MSRTALLSLPLCLFVACGDAGDQGSGSTESPASSSDGSTEGGSSETSAGSSSAGGSTGSPATSTTGEATDTGSSESTGDETTTAADPPDAPAWVLDLTPGVWVEVGTNTIADVDPADDPNVNPNFPNSPPWRGNSGQGAVTNAWNGGAFAPTLGESGALLAWGGGHQDYFGNELYAFDLATQTWERLTDPFAEPLTWPYADGIFSDGTPAPPHTYDFVEFHPPTNSFVVLRTMEAPNPNNVPVAAMLSLDTLQWRRSPRNTASHHNSGGFSAYDSLRDVMWAEGGSGTDTLTAFDVGAENDDGTFGVWTNYDDKLGGTLDEVAAYDPIHDIIVATRFRNGERMFGIDPGDPEADAVELLQQDAPEVGGAHGWEWSERREAFVYWRTGASVYEVALDGADWRTDPWVWTELTSAENSLAPEASRVYSKFRIARYGDVEVAVAVVETDRPVYAFRIPE